MRYRPATLLFLLLSAAFPAGAEPGLGSAAGVAPPPWLHAGADSLQYLASRPTECVDLSGPPALHAQVEAGRQLFRSPGLLGGWAGEAGLSCESCHPGGRAQTAFHLPVRSAAPGTVALESLEAAAARPIPPLLDLADGPALANSVAHHLERDFGTAAPGSFVAALSTYLGALSVSYCPAERLEALDLDGDIYEINRSINNLQYFLEVKNEDMTAAAAVALRANLRTVGRRFAALPALAEALAELAVELDGVEQDSRRAGSAFARDRLRRWQRRWLAFTPRLRAAEGESLYARERLEEWLRSQ